MNRFYLLFSTVFSLFTLNNYAKEANPFAPKLQFAFVENKGQVVNQEGQMNQDVLYLFRTGNMQVQLRKNGFSYELFREEGEQLAPHLLIEQGAILTSPVLKTHRVDIDFKGANSSIEIVELEKAQTQPQFSAKGSANAFISCSNFRRILYKNVYPQTDIEFLISDENEKQNFKYNVILHPGADARLVQLAIFGSNRTQLSKNGNLEFETSLGKMEEQIPLSFELEKNGTKGKSIEAKFVLLSKNVFGFGLNQPITQTTRVIDPILWCTYLGGSGTDISVSLDGDSLGNVFMAGYTNSSSNIATAGAYQTTYSGPSGYDVFLAKFSNDGVLQWATYYGGSINENVLGIKVTKNGNIVLVGQTQSNNGIATAGAYQTTLGGSADAFIAMFNTSGNLLWASYFGGDMTESFYGVYEDSNSDLIMVGSSNSSMNFNYPGIHKSTHSGNSDVILVKMSSSGSVKWATYYGGAMADYAYGVCTDLLNNIYFVGTTASETGIAFNNPYQPNIAGGHDGFIAKFSTNGAQLFGTYFGGSDIDYPRGILINQDGNLAIAGYTYSLTGFPLKNAYQSTFESSSNQGFICMMDTTGNLLWSTLFGGELVTILINFNIDQFGDIYICGYTTSSTKIATPGADREVISGNYDAFFGSFNKSGSINWCTYFGGSKFDYSWKPYIDKNQNLFVGGYTNSDSLSIGSSVHQPNTDGTFDAFFLKMELGLPSGGPLGNNTIGTDQTLCGSSIANNLIGSTPTGGTGSYSYTWLQSPTGLDGSYVGATGTNSNKDYSPGSIVAETYYKRVVTDGSAFDTSNAVIIKIGSTFKAGFTVNKTIQCLRSNEFIFTDTTSATGLTYDWDFGNGATSTNQSETISYAYQAANVYKVRLITSFGGSCADTNYKTVYTVSDPIAKTITGLDQVGRLDTASYFVPHSSGSRYSWVFDNGQLKGNGTGNQIQIKWTAVGTTQLKVVETSSGNCLGDTAYLDITISPALELEELTNENAFQVYPNPNSGSFVIGGLNQKEFTVNVYDARGALVKTQVIQGETRIELENARAGLYVIHLINSDGNVFTKKMQVQEE
ncbi:MAG: SBBP repeat-containing protein [Bacteroidia bacterium]|nr:SBBP repeat-containing protein [Bacteroidia bacterium]MCF8428449.1 SBBP repeat-containing protein [Bacteroidia bacterium]